MLSAWRRHCVIVSCGWFCKVIFLVTQLLTHRKHLDRVWISKHIIYYVSHLINIMNVLSRFMRPASLTASHASLYMSVVTIMRPPIARLKL